MIVMIVMNSFIPLFIAKGVIDACFTFPGIHFYEEVGCLTIGGSHDEFLTNTYKSAANQGIHVKKLNKKETADKFPYMKVFDTTQSVYEMQDAGHINPRRMRDAQLTAAHLQGCDIITDIASHVTEVSSPDGGKLMQIRTDGGLLLQAKKVLLAVGGFATFRDLLPKGIVPHIISKAQTVIFAELSEEDIQNLK